MCEHLDGSGLSFIDVTNITTSCTEDSIASAVIIQHQYNTKNLDFFDISNFLVTKLKKQNCIPKNKSKHGHQSESPSAITLQLKPEQN